ncbi:MAG: efflux RND transporter periplasmic adaptor subunit [Bacillota bacterium]|nr:efflux RND transporter periplasmic adaptor subunit [Bacillota bacterium]
MKSMTRKNKILIGITALVILLAAGTIIFFAVRTGKAEDKSGEVNNPPNMEGMEGNIISASGLTSVGMLEENLKLSFLETELYIEESYLSIGDEVEAGTAVFRISDETLENARKELQDAVTEAQLAYRQGVLDYEEDSLDAKTVYESAEINQKYAQAEYESAVNKAASDVEELEQQVEEAALLVEEYEKSINEDYYRTYYKVDELYENYCDHFNLLMETYEKWDIETLEEQNNGLSGGMSGLSAEGGGGMQSAGGSDDSQKLTVYNLLDEMVQQEGEAYEEALETYEKARDQAQAGLLQAQSNLAALEAELTQAQTDYEKELVTCKADYETTLSECQNAQTIYETTMQGLDETLLALEMEQEDAIENLTLFEESLGDGYFYTKNAGTIVMNAITENTYLSGDVLVVAYSNPETVTISANVDQSNIADIAIGDAAYVIVSEYGNYQGTVTTINPVTQAGSRSSVTYQVVVTLEGDVSELESNLTAYVYFGDVDAMIRMSGEPDGNERIKSAEGSRE